MVESAQTINLNVQGLDVLLSVPILVGLLMLLDTAVQPILQHMSSSSSSVWGHQTFIIFRLIFSF